MATAAVYWPAGTPVAAFHWAAVRPRGTGRPVAVAAYDLRMGGVERTGNSFSPFGWSLAGLVPHRHLRFTRDAQLAVKQTIDRRTHRVVIGLMSSRQNIRWFIRLALRRPQAQHDGQLVIRNERRLLSTYLRGAHSAVMDNSRTPPGSADLSTRTLSTPELEECGGCSSGPSAYGPGRGRRHRDRGYLSSIWRQYATSTAVSALAVPDCIACSLTQAGHVTGSEGRQARHHWEVVSIGAAYFETFTAAAQSIYRRRLNRYSTFLTRLTYGWLPALAGLNAMRRCAPLKRHPRPAW